MRRSDHDLKRVQEHELPRLTQDELLRLVVICRDGDQSTRKRAQEAWAILIALDIDRVRGIVATFRFPGQANVHVHPNHLDDVVVSAFERLVKMLGTFKGATEGEYRAALRTCVRFECMDHCRGQMEQDKKRAGSLDERIEDGEGGHKLGRYDRVIAKQDRERLQDEEAQREELAHEQRLERRLRDAITSLDGDRRRVLELTRAGRSTSEIASELETSNDNVYQLRRRGLQDVRRILDEDGEH